MERFIVLWEIIMIKKAKLAVLLSAAYVASSLAHAEETVEPIITFSSITVTADPLGERSPDEIILPVSVLAGEDLAKQQALTLGDTLDSLPGVANSDFGPGVGRPVVRGLQGSRVQVLEDGLKTADIAGEGADHAIAIDSARADQIEVFRGPATLLYGSGAAGGVINVKTKRFDPDFADSPTLEGQMLYGTNGNTRQGNVGLALPLTENLVIRADYNRQSNDDSDIKGFQQKHQTVGDKDRLQNSDTDTESASITALYKDNWGYAGLGFSTWHTDYAIPEVSLGIGEEEQERILANYDRIDFRGQLNNPLAGFDSVRLKLSHTNYTQQEVGFEFDNGRLADSGVEADFENNESEIRVEMLHQAIGLWQGVIGLQFNDRDFTATSISGGHGGEFYVRPNSTESYGLFLLEERLTDFGHLEFSARVDQIDSSPQSLTEYRDIDLPSGTELIQDANLGERSFTPFSLSAGTLIDVGLAHHLRLSLTRSQRAPSAEQLYAFGSHAAARTIEIGDPSLGKETYTNLELGFERHTGLIRYDATVFYNQVKDFIYLASAQDNSGNSIEIEGDQLVFNQQDDAEFYGAEFTAIADIIKGANPLSLRLSGDHVTGKLGNGDNLPRMSPTRLGFGIDTAYADWDLSIDYRHVFKQTNTAISEDSTDGYNLLSFDLFWRPNNFEGGELFIQGRNLLNEDGRHHQSFLKDEAPITGRTIMTGLRFQFGD